MEMIYRLTDNAEYLLPKYRSVHAGAKLRLPIRNPHVHCGLKQGGLP